MRMKSTKTKSHSEDRVWFEYISENIKDILSGNNEAIEWLYTDDFNTCCTLAGLSDSEPLKNLLEHAMHNVGLHPPSNT
jgi:hypothetical protein